MVAPSAGANLPERVEPEELVARDSLRLVRLRLTLTLVATAILPVAVGAPAIRAITDQARPLAIEELAGLASIVALLVGLIAWMAHKILQPAAELEASRARLRLAYREAREVALRDGLTGLGNHRAFQEEFEAYVAQASRYGHPVSLVLLDIDEFKLVNDAAGHAVGDDLLAEVGRILRRTTRQADRAYRIGGDEFALLLPHTGADGAQQLARRLLLAGLEARPESRYERPISFSAGVAAFPEHGTSREQLQQRADSALYRGKRSGRTVVTLVDLELDREQVDAQKRAALSAAVVRVLAERALRPVYQPIVHLASGRILGFEGLIRPLPESGFSNPGSLFAAADVGGRVVELDLACLDTVLGGAAAVPAPLLVTVNLSPRTLEAPEFGATRLLALLDRAGIAPGRVIVELTERETISDAARVATVLERLRAAGVRVAADDVGAGNAGLRLLSQFRFDVVKIDLSLVQAGAGQETVRHVLKTLVDLSARWHALVVAEGIETSDQLAMVRDLGIGAGQGYLLARPANRVVVERVDMEALMQPARDPYTRLGLERPVAVG
jgi:diguanylate cyclase (GGDEF)-like protein